MSSPTTFKFDEQITQTLEELKKNTRAASKSEVLRRAILLLKVAEEAQRKGEKLVLKDDKGAEREIIVA